MRGKLITLEGIECSGKGTQIKLIIAYLKQKDIQTFTKHEPGGTLYGEALRAIIKHPELALTAIYGSINGHEDFPQARLGDNPDYNRTPACELFLFEAARAEFAQSIAVLVNEIRAGAELLADGSNVICDRFFDSSTAYQGAGRGLPLEQIELMNKIALAGLWPDLTFFLDIPVATMIERMQKENDQKNSFFEKRCDRDFFERVRQGYLAIAAREPNRVVIIDSSRSVEEVFEQIRPHLNRLFGINKM